MPASAIIDIGSEYSGSGVTQATSDVNKLGSSMDGVSSKTDGLLKRLERPLGRTLFASVAMEMVGAGGAAEGASKATIALEGGLHAAAMGAMFLGGPMASVALVVAGVLAIILKLNSAFNKSGEAIAKEVDDASKLQTSMKDNADALLKLNKITKDQHDLLIKLSEAKGKDAAADVENARQKMVSAQASLAEAKANEASNAGLRFHGATLNQVAQTQKIYNQALQTYTTALGPSSANTVKTDTEAQAKNALILQSRADLMHQLFVSTDSLEDLQKRQAVTEQQLQDVENDIINTTDPKKLADLEKEQVALSQLNDDYNNQIKALQNLKSNTKSITTDIVDIYENMTRDIASDFKNKNGQIIFDGAQFGQQLIKQTADFASKQLEIAAIRDLANPLTVPIGIAELAAAGAISVLGGIAGAAAGPDSSTAGASGSGSTVNNSSSSSNNNNMTLNVTIAGGIADLGTTQAIVKAINSYVQQNNGTLIASNVKPAIGQVPGL